MEKIPWMLYRREDRIREPERSGNEFRSELDYLRGLYPVSAKKSQILAEEACDLLEYPESPMYDEYPDRFMLYHICSLVKDEMTKDASAQEMPGGFLDDLIQVLVYQEISRRRCRCRRCRQYFPR